MTESADLDDVVKELVDLEVDRVDGVKGPASGIPWLVMKSLEDPSTQAALAASMEDDRITKAEKSTKAIDDLPDSDFAYIEPGGKTDDEGKTVPRRLRHFPLVDAAHVRDALSRAPQSPFGDKAMPKIKAAAKRFGIDQEDKVTKAGEPTDQTVIKADDPAALPDADELMDEAKPGAAGAEVPTDSPGDPDDPESPAWEAVDAARARQAVNLVVGLQRLVGEALARESQEVSVGADPDDGDNAYDLAGVLDCLDCVLDTLAPFAVGEQAEADEREADAVSVVTKAGRVLSSANEERIQAAVKSLQQVLASLPAATEPEGGPMADEPVAKAATDKTLTAVYTQGGKLLGVVDAEKITSVATGDDDEPADTPPADDTPAAETAEADEPAAPAEPAEPADAGVDTPASPAADADDDTPVAKTADPQNVADVVEAAVTKALEAEREQYQPVLKALEERLATVEAQPMPGGPLLNGATAAGTPILRGQDLGSTPEIETVRKALETEDDPVRQADLRRQLTFLQMKGAFGN